MRTIFRLFIILALPLAIVLEMSANRVSDKEFAELLLFIFGYIACVYLFYLFCGLCDDVSALRKLKSQSNTLQSKADSKKEDDSKADSK